MSNEFKGANGRIIVEADKIILKHNFKAHPTKEIYYKDISSIELKKPDSFYFNRFGYIEFRIVGDYFIHPMETIKNVADNSNALFAGSKSQYQNMLNAKLLIEQHIAELRPQDESAASSTLTSTSAANVIDELKKGAELRDAGILTNEEFEQLKRKLMNS
jgi:hypothetical protein